MQKPNNQMPREYKLRIIAILKGQSADISFDDEDEDQLLEEVLEEDDYEVVDETSDDAEEYDESEYEDLLDDEEPVGYENATVRPEVTHKADLPKASPLSVRKEIRKGEPAVTGPLNWFEEEAEVEELPGPDFITYGCWVKVLEEKNNKEIIYHIPLKDDHSRAWYGMEEKMMGQNVGFRVFLAGRHYTVIAFGRDEDREDTKAEFNVSPES